MRLLKASERVTLMKLLDLPTGAKALYEDLAGQRYEDTRATFYGDTVEDVIRFALLNWLSTNHRTVLDVLKERDRRIDT